ncbi:MAG: ATP-binding cassette domain-containing protein [Candidatus Nanopelagicales bacterium]
MSGSQTLASETREPTGQVPVLAVSGLRKEYGAVVALADANLEIPAGEIHALVGENGSGKSTLVGLVSGTVAPTAGTVLVDGHQLSKHLPAESRAAGAVTVFQDGSMLPELTVAQNLYIGTAPEARPAYRDVDRWAAEVLAYGGLTGIAPRTPTSQVPPGDRQLIEIARAMYARPRLLMLDEATSALDLAGVDRVMHLIEQAAAQGSAVLFVTHRLSEVFRVAQRISVLRDGEWQGTVPAAGLTANALVDLMAGTSVDVEFPERTPLSEDRTVVLAAESLTGRGLSTVDLALRSGEILGIAGADGNGQGQLLRALAAVDGPQGRLTVDDRLVETISGSSAAGVVYLSSDRRNESLLPSLSVRENLTVSVLDRLSTWGVIRRKEEDAQVSGEIDRFGIRVGTPEQGVQSLSGGNQQKVALSRALSDSPRVLLIDEPTKGVDVRSRMDIYRMLRDAADDGIAVAVVSSDASELAGIADRIVVMSRGRIIHEMAGLGSTEEEIVGAFTVVGHATDDHPVAEAARTSTGERLAVRLRRAVGGAEDFLRMGVLALVLLVLFFVAKGLNPAFGSQGNIYNVLLVALPLTVVAAAQFCVLVVGGIDVSVGATMTLVVVVLSYLVTTGGLVQQLVLGLLVALVVGGLVGAVNALLIEGGGLSAVIATIATLGIVNGISLILRPTPGGLLAPEIMTLLTSKVGPVPWMLIVVLPLLAVGDFVLWRTGAGLQIRSSGLHPAFAHRLGIPVRRVRIAAYLSCAAVAGLAGLVLAGQVGTGDANVANGYTLLAIAAPVLGGASLLGGRGSLLGCFLGAAVLAVSQAIVPMLGVSDAWSFLIVGTLSIIALLAYSRGGRGLRGGRAALRRLRVG